MLDDRRYILIPFGEITPEMMEDCIQSSPKPQPVMFKDDATDWRVLKWRGDKPHSLWQHFPIMSDQEIRDILKANIHPANFL